MAKAKNTWADLRGQYLRACWTIFGAVAAAWVWTWWEEGRNAGFSYHRAVVLLLSFLPVLVLFWGAPATPPAPLAGNYKVAADHIARANSMAEAGRALLPTISAGIVTYAAVEHPRPFSNAAAAVAALSLLLTYFSMSLQKAKSLLRRNAILEDGLEGLARLDAWHHTVLERSRRARITWTLRSSTIDALSVCAVGAAGYLYLLGDQFWRG